MPNYEIPGDVDINRGLVGYWKLDNLKEIPSDGIIAHYKMNDNAANTVVIDSKGGNNGVASANTSTLTTVGKINEALQFDGVATVVNLPSDMLSGLNRFSISSWVRFETDTGNRATICQLSFNFDNDQGVILRRQDEGHGSNPKQMIVRFGQTSYTFDKVLENDTWYNILITHEGTTTKLYIGGSLEQTLTTEAFSFGGFGDSLGDEDVKELKGRIDDFRIYDRTLSSSEVSTINNSGTGTETTELFRQTIVAIDRAKNHNHGTITGATNTEGINGLNPNAMFFDGVDDFVEIPHDVNQLGVNLTNGFTISAWINPKSKGEIGGRILDKSTGSTGQEGFRYFMGDNNIRININGGISRDSAASSVPYGEWTHVLITISSAQIASHYINGVISGTPADLVETIAAITTTNNPRIGNRAADATTSRTFDGSIQKLRFYNRVLTQGEISKLYRLKL